MEVLIVQTAGGVPLMVCWLSMSGGNGGSDLRSGLQHGPRGIKYNWVLVKMVISGSRGSSNKHEEC